MGSLQHKADPMRRLSLATCTGLAAVGCKTLLRRDDCILLL